MQKFTMVTAIALALLGTAALAEAPPFDYVPTDGLIAYYPFNGDALDWGPNSWDGTVHGSPTYVETESPWRNRAISMNGATDYVQLNPDLVGDYVSIGVWVKTTTTAMGGESSPLLARLRMQGFALFLNFASVGDMGIDLYNSSTRHYVASVGDVTLNDGRWHHICVCYGPDRGLEIYIDGSLRLADDSQGLTPLYSTDGGLTLSRDATISGHYYGGLMDEVVFYDRALSAGEVAILYEEGLVVPTSDSSWGNVKALFR